MVHGACWTGVRTALTRGPNARILMGNSNMPQHDRKNLTRLLRPDRQTAILSGVRPYPPPPPPQPGGGSRDALEWDGGQRVICRAAAKAVTSGWKSGCGAIVGRCTTVGGQSTSGERSWTGTEGPPEEGSPSSASPEGPPEGLGAKGAAVFDQNGSENENCGWGRRAACGRCSGIALGWG